MMLVQRATSLSMMPRYSATGGAASRAEPRGDAPRAAADRRERIVDLVHHASRELPHRRELLGLVHRALDGARFGDVLADRDHVRDGDAVDVHRQARRAIGAHLVADMHFLLVLLRLAGGEDLVEFRLAAPRPAAAADTSMTRRPSTSRAPQPLRAGFALAIPEHDAVVRGRPRRVRPAANRW